MVSKPSDQSAEAWRLPPRLSVSHNHVLLDPDRHVFWIFAGNLCTALKFRPMLFPGFLIGNESVRVPAHSIHCFRAISRHEEMDGRLRSIVQAHVSPIVLSDMVDWLTAPKFADDVRGFDQSLRPLWPLRPRTSGCLFIQSFTGTDTKKNTSRRHEI